MGKVKKFRKTVVSVALAFSMVSAPVLPTYAAENDTQDTGDAALQEIARQMNEDKDPFAFREAKGDRSSGAIRNSSYAGSDIEPSVSSIYPASFDLRNVDTDGDGEGDTSYVTSVKFQNPFGTCWGFSAIAASEISILGSPDLQIEGLDAKTMNLSEKHLTWFLQSTVDDPENPQYGEGRVFVQGSDKTRLDMGGFPFIATGIFAQGMGPVFEVDSETKDGTTVEYNFGYHGKEKLVQYLKRENGDFVRGEDGYPVFFVDKESELPENAIPYCYSGQDDWSIDDEYKYMQSFKLAESYQIPSPGTLEGEERDMAINAMKEQLINKRGVMLAYAPDQSVPVDGEGNELPTRYMSKHWAQYTYQQNEPSHAVTIVGWDDNYPKEYFRHPIAGVSDEVAEYTTTPDHDGAWLVKNSWGSGEEEFPNRGVAGWGALKGQDVPGSDYSVTEDVKTGYFWLSYDDKSIALVEAVRFDQINDEEYDIFQYDYMPVNSVNSAFLRSEIKMANTFVTPEDILLEQVSCQTTTPGTTVHYEIYQLRDDAENPDDGTLLAEFDQTYPLGGFHKETLPEELPIRAGNVFSVVISQMTPDGLYTISTQMSAGKEQWKDLLAAGKSASYAVGVINEGESMFLAGGKWNDLSQEWVQDLLKGRQYLTLEMDNFPIKAFAKPTELPEEESQWVQTSDGWKYRDSKGDFVKNRWYEIADKEGTKKWYFFDKDGYMEKNAYRQGYYLKSNGEWDGKAKASGWKHDSKGWWYSTGGNNFLRNGWKRIDGNWYYFKANGYIAMNEFVQGWWLNKDGVQKEPVHCSWFKTGGKWWYGVKGGWYAKNGPYIIDGETYTFDRQGYLKE